MSKRHQASRRRSYGRRLHDLHERPDLRQADGRGVGDGGEELHATVGHAGHIIEARTGRFAAEFVD